MAGCTKMAAGAEARPEPGPLLHSSAEMQLRGRQYQPPGVPGSGRTLSGWRRCCGGRRPRSNTDGWGWAAATVFPGALRPRTSGRPQAEGSGCGGTESRGGEKLSTEGLECAAEGAQRRMTAGGRGGGWGLDGER